MAGPLRRDVTRWQRAVDWYGITDARAYGRTAWLLTLGTLITGTGRGIVAPFLIIFLTREQGISLEVIGLGITLEFAIRALVGPVAGAYSDRHGRKPLMLLGLLATSIILPSYLLVRTPGAYYALSVLNGLVAAHSIYGPAANAMVVDVIPRERRGGVFGLIHASRNLGWTFGIALGALLVGYGFLPVFLVAGVLPFSYFFVVLALIHESVAKKPTGVADVFRSWGSVVRRPAFVAYLVLSIAFFLGWGHLNTIFPLFLTEGLELADSAVAVLAINSVLVVALQIPFGRMADRMDRPRLLSAAALALGVTYLGYAWALHAPFPPLAVVSAAVVAFTLAEMLYSPILSAYAAELAPAGTTGSALGILGFSMAIGQGAPPLLADALVPGHGWDFLWVLMALLTLPAAIGLLALGARVRKAADEAPVPG